MEQYIPELIALFVALVTAIIGAVIAKLDNIKIKELKESNKQIMSVIQSSNEDLYVRCPYCNHLINLKTVKILTALELENSKEIESGDRRTD